MEHLKASLLALITITAACETNGFDEPESNPPTIGPSRVAMVSGSIIDWETGSPIEGASVVIDSGWGSTPFPTDSVGFARLTTNAEGEFGPVEVVFEAGLSTTFALFRVTGEGLAPTASDQRMDCSANGSGALRCDPIDHKIVVPSITLANTWREQLASESVVDAAGVGLVLFEYLEPDGASAAEVETTIVGLDGTEDADVRYLDEGGIAIDTDATATTLSGLSLIATADNASLLSGKRAEQTWLGTGVLAASGWIFVEDRTVGASIAR